jgi:predicted Ser/Thr protein kinase
MRLRAFPALLALPALLAAAPAAADTRAVGDSGWLVDAPRELPLLGSGPGNDLLRWGRQWNDGGNRRQPPLRETETIEAAVERPKRAPACAAKDALQGTRFGRPTVQYTCPPVGQGAPEQHFVMDLEGGGAIHLSYRHEWRVEFQADGRKGFTGLGAQPRIRSPHLRDFRQLVRSLTPGRATARVLDRPGRLPVGDFSAFPPPGSCGSFDTADPPRPVETPCPGEDRIIPGLLRPASGTMWRPRPDAPGEYWTDIQYRMYPEGPVIAGLDAWTPLYWRVARVAGGTWAMMPARPADWARWAAVENAVGRREWAAVDAAVALALAPGEPRFKALADRFGPLPDAGSAPRVKTAQRMYETIHALYEHQHPDEALRWADAALALDQNPQVARLRDALAAPGHGGGAAQAALNSAAPMADASKAPEPVDTPALLRPVSSDAPLPVPMGPRGESVDELKRGAPVLGAAEAAARPAPSSEERSSGPLLPLALMLTLGLGIGMVIVIFKPRAAAAPAVAVAAADAPRPPSQTPTVIDDATLRATARQGAAPSLSRYQVGRQIGAGGMGIVFEGTDRRLGRRVAIKQMRRELRDNPKDRENFLSEARIISALSHPYIVAFHEVIEEGDELFLVFEFVDGEPLSRRLQNGQRLPVAHAQRVFTQVCEAISCAHRAHVLHRDLKPANIMLGKDGYAKVMDFGIARQAKDTITRLTNTDASGTPAYMAPEQHLGRCNKASDIYALGVCLYESLTGQLPFPGPDFLAQKERMKYAPPQFLNAELPKVAELLFQVTLAADPSKRVADAEELIESLKRLG